VASASRVGHLLVGGLALFQFGRFLARVDDLVVGLLGHRASVTVLPGGAGISLAIESTWP
jgi:hypothetical protein